MLMYPQGIGSIPAETVRIARAACPKGTLAMRLRDALGALYTDEQFAALYPVEGQPAYAPWRLAVVTVLQYSENLTDRQAANAVRERIDWKSHGLRNELTDSERLLPNGLLEGKEPLFFQQGDLHDKYR